MSVRACRAKRHPEAEEQRRLVAVLRLCHIPFSASLNGVRLPPALAKRAHEQGMEPGDPDVVVWQRPPGRRSSAVTGMRYCDRVGMAIELKRPDLRPKTERAHRWSGAEPHQRERLEMLESEGWHCVVAYGCEHALQLMREAGYEVPGMAGMGGG